MELNLSQIKHVTQGTVRITQEDDGYHFYRFSGAHEELYRHRNPEFYMKSMATSGVQLRFLTNSKKFEISGTAFPATARTYFAFDIFVNGSKIGVINNYNGVDLPENYTTVQLNLGDFSGEFDLGDGVKELRVVFPWSVKAVIKKIVLDEEAFLEPVKPKHTLLCFGDSITQGFDALCPSNKYTTKLADYLGAEEINKAIGGEVFFPALAAENEGINPDYVLVAYGTNDWAKCTKEEFIRNCRGFYKAIFAAYPKAKIFAVTPIWREECETVTRCGEFSLVAETIRSVAEKYPNVAVLNGYEFVPHDPHFFGDLRLHPNDAGFAAYFRSLKEQIMIP